MRLFTRRRQVIVVVLAALVIVLLLIEGVLFFSDSQSLEEGAGQIVAGMSRGEVEGILGKPYMDMRRTEGRGETWIWIDQLWQVEVYTGADQHVEFVRCVPSDSLYRRTVGPVIPAP